MNYRCSQCGAAAYFDGRCGDGPILLCGCDNGPWVDDGRGGYHYPTGAKAIPAGPSTQVAPTQQCHHAEAIRQGAGWVCKGCGVTL
jgi:hypothetical protein